MLGFIEWQAPGCLTLTVRMVRSQVARVIQMSNAVASEAARSGR